MTQPKDVTTTTETTSNQQQQNSEQPVQNNEQPVPQDNPVSQPQSQPAPVGDQGQPADVTTTTTVNAPPSGE